MTTRAARRNAERRAVNVSKREAAGLAANTNTPQPERNPKRDGLEWLRSKRHISEADYLAGLWYADRYRWAKMEGATPIASCLGDKTGSGAGDLALAQLEIIDRINDARTDFAAIEARIGWDTPNQLALLAVCIRGERLAESRLGRTASAMTIGAFRTTLGHLAQIRRELENNRLTKTAN